ncbi:MAG: PQQ-dependent sugar dehydrogenase [Pseudomonadota bacterium]
MGLSWALAFAGPAVALPSSQGPLTVTATVTGLDEPWGFAFLPEGGVLITERSGTLIHVAPDGTRSTVTGTPRVADAGQGGLLDILLPRDFAQTREVYLTFAARQRGGAGTALARATLSADAARLEGTEVIWELASGSSGGRHFGSRVVEGADGFLYVTIGDRGDRPSAQDLSNENGSVVRVARDGSIPASNPDLGQGARPGIYSYGHRNPQGAAVDAQGRIWVVEHGAAGGDEVNLVEAGANYGWPTISYGRHYSGAKIGVGTSAPGLKQPMHYWDPSIAPSGMMIYSGKLWPSWEGDIFVGSLKFDMISRLERGTMVREIERLSSDETLRVRDIREAPDGTIWFLSVGQGALYRISL